MAGEWITRKIGALGRVVTGKTPSTDDATNFGGPYPFITIPDLNGRAVIDRAERTLSQKGAEIIKSCLLPPGAVMMSCIATIGRCGVTAIPSFTNQQINSIVPSKNIDSRFLYYVFTQLGHELESAGGGGSVYTNVSKSRFSDIEISLPEDVSEQRAIAHILGTLDDKIELNRRMNETLEAMAHALFKSWFVDFDPVHAKAEGRDTGLPKPIADLFPARLVDFELGEIPEGWEVGTLADFSSLNSEAWSNKTRPPIINYVDLSNTKWGRIEAVTAYAQQDAPSRARRVLRPRDTIVGTVRPGNGSYAFISEDGFTGSTGFAVLRPLKPTYAEFVYLAATARDNIEALSHLADGGAYPAVRPGVVAGTQVIRPTEEVLRSFSRAVAPLLAKSAGNERESQFLAALRDTLLPKLISGELRVKDAVRFIRSPV